MIRQRVSLAVAGAIVASAALTTGMASSASAADSVSPYDPGFVPAAGDLVGVGSDTIEIALDYLSKGRGRDKVRLTATIDAASDPVGTLTFKEDGDPIGGPIDVTNGDAVVKNLTLVPNGEHHYSANFTPTDPLAFTASDSGSVTTSVKTPSSITAGLLNPSGTYGSTRLLAVGADVDGDAATGSISVKIDNGTPVNVPLLGGAAFYTVPGNLAVGTHSVTATLASTATAEASAKTVTLTVTKASTKASFKFLDPTIKASTTPKATVTVRINGASSAIRPSGKITLKYGSKTVGTGTVTNGVAKVNLSRFKKRSSAYGIRATFTSTNSNYSSSPASATVKLKVS